MKSKYDGKIKKLMGQMTLKEKIGQLTQTSYYGQEVTGPVFDSCDTVNQIKNMEAGSMLNVTDIDVIYKFQKLAVEETRLHIPLMFMLDVIHGYKVSYPTPLSMSCSFDEKLIKQVCKDVAYESYHSGINITFSPMLDYVSDARWGRVNESNGEDPYLSCKLTSSYVKGYQYNNRLGACCKHFVGYAACESGKDYYRSTISDIDLYQNYLPPFKQAFKDNVYGVMFSFSSLNGIAMLTNTSITKDLLRDNYKYDGFSISDHGAVKELINFKIAKDSKEASSLSIKSGVDIEMATTCYNEGLFDSCMENKEYIKYVDESCYRVLHAKYKLGLFDDPYKNIYLDNDKFLYRENALKDAYKIASESFVMLKNDDNLLPIKSKTKVCLLGPYARSNDLVGPWGGKQEFKDNISLLDELSTRNEVEILNEDEFESADVCIMCLGETSDMHGESRSRANLSLPIDQEELLEKVYSKNKNVVLVIFAGRPLVLSNYINKCKSILYSFFLGMTSSKVLIDCILGKFSPSGKLSISFPRSVGQCPITYQHYHVGRPNESKEKDRPYELCYIDERLDPLFVFSEGMSFNTYKYSDFSITKNHLTSKKDNLVISFSVENNGNYESDEIVFMFVESLHSSIVRPENELKGYKRIHLKPFEKKIVSFSVGYKDLTHINKDLVNSADEGDYLIKIGHNIKEVEIFKIKFGKN